MLRQNASNGWLKEGLKVNNNRYLVDFNSNELEKIYNDVLIIGSGIAGIYTSLKINEKYKILILTKEKMDMSNSVLAQGGIAVSLGKSDSPELHFKDTLYAGAGLCNEDTVWVLVNEAASNIKDLCKYGVNFDRTEEDTLSLSREAAHSKNRIIHAGDTTGKEVLDTILAEAVKRQNIEIKERVIAVDLITENDECRAVLAYDEQKGKYCIYVAPVIIIASGGYGRLYYNTTNPEMATGDGVCMAYRAGCELMDLEFVQFHPTVLYHKDNKSFLISEAVRGEGGILRNIHGERFMSRYHELLELAPRDVVSRAIFEEMKRTNSTNVFVDITHKDKEWIENRFPNIYKTCLEYGIDMSKDYIPVAPAEHYCMGGIKVDVFGRTNIKGLFACGEAACNGIHGANRLASNSMLEGLVFGNKISGQVDEIIDSKKKDFYFNETVFSSERIQKEIEPDALITEIQKLMVKKAGIVRDGNTLREALERLTEIEELTLNMENVTTRDMELSNIVLLSKFIVSSALERQESRGAHFRSDFPQTDVSWKRNIVIKNRELY
jgi:L-aspartate oxidase